jgi:hypothetical protein
MNRLLRDRGPGWEVNVMMWIVTITGLGAERHADAAASLAATVVGVHGIA